jgi:hypothetical protein
MVDANPSGLGLTYTLAPGDWRLETCRCHEAVFIDCHLIDRWLLNAPAFWRPTRPHLPHRMLLPSDPSLI